MQEASTLNYDIVFRVLTFLITILTWFVVYNGATHLATRNESKELLGDLHNELKDKLDEAVEHWIKIIKSNGEDKIERSLFLQHSLIHISHLRHIKELFTIYNLSPMGDKDIDELKRLLTESPDKDIRADATALEFPRSHLFHKYIYLSHLTPVNDVDRERILLIRGVLYPLNLSLYLAHEYL